MGEGLKRARAAVKKNNDAIRAAKRLAAEENAALFLALLKREGLPAPQREYQFHPDRKWRTDYAWPLAKLALEVEGGVWTGGRHTRGAGFLKDCAKYNELAALGWRLLRTTPSGLYDGETIGLIRRTLQPSET